MKMSDTGNKALKHSANTAPNAFGSLRNWAGLLAQSVSGWITRSSIACIAILLLTVLGASPLLAQKVHPVEVQLQLTPPYSLYLSDYATAEERLKVNLFLKDLTKTDHPVRLKLKIEGFGITIVSKNNFYTPPIYLNGGQLRVLSGPELQDYFNPQNLMFQGIDLKTFNQNGAKLPEGVYRISFEVEDYTRRQIVSNAGGTVLSAFLSYPPVINQPMAEAKVRAMFPQNVVFQWMPRHTASVNAAFNVAYRIRLVEIDPPGRNPNDAIRSMRPLFETVTNLTQYVYGPADPQLTPGHTYALQVQAIEVDGKDAFVNQGYSEVVRFTYGEKCSLPLNVIAQIEDRSSLKLSWTQLPLQQRYAVRYREANNPKAAWFEQEVFASQFSARGLRPGVTYEYQVKAACDYGFGDYTALQTFTLPNESVTSGDIVCGEPSQLQAPTNTKLLPLLQPGMLFMAASFPVRVTEVTSQGERFTGRGTVGVPYLNKLNFEVDFKDIQINTDLQLISGRVSVRRQSLEQSQQAVLRAVTVTPDKNGVVEAVASNGLPTIIDAAVAEPDVLPVYTSSPAKTVTFAGITSGGKAQEITIKLKEGQPPFVFQDKNGETYEVDESGKVIHRGKVPTSGLLAGGVLSNQQLSTDKATVTFKISSDHKYGLDNFQQAFASNTRYAQDYQQVQTSQGSTRVGWKSVESGRGDVVLAEVNLLDKNLELSKVEFRNGEHEKIPSRQLDGSNRFAIDVMGAPEGNDKEIYAFYPTSEDKKTGLYLGKLNIASFRKITKKVVVVPVNGAGAGFSIETVSAYLNKVYKQAVVEWDVTVEADFKADAAKWDFDKNGLDAGNSSAMSAYTDEQKALANSYRENNPLEKGTYYIFLVDRFSESTQKGYMVRGGQVGFVAAPTGQGQDKEVLHTMAHELGHGAFALQHTGDLYGESTKESTHNLMDYSKGDSIQVWYRQWKYMRNPDIIFRPFEGDDKGALMVSVATLLPDDEVIKNPTPSSQPSKKYLTPSGRVIAIPAATASQTVLLGFAQGENITKNVPVGALTSFTIAGKQYVAEIVDGVFNGYKSGKEIYRSIEEIPSGLVIEVNVGEHTSPCHATGYRFTYTNPELTQKGATLAGKLSDNKSFIPKQQSDTYRLTCPSSGYEVAMETFVKAPQRYLLEGFKDESLRTEMESKVKAIAEKIDKLGLWYNNSRTAPISHQGTKEWLNSYEEDLDKLIAQVAKIKEQVASPLLDITTVDNIFLQLKGQDRQFQSFTAEERLNLLAVLSSHTVSDYNGRELQVLKIISGTPAEQYSDMLEGLAKRKDVKGKYPTLLVGLIRCIDGDNFTSYIEHLHKWIKSKNSYSLDECLANGRYLKFKPGFWTGDDLFKTFTSTGSINFTTLPKWQIGGAQSMRDVSPYEYILLHFEDDFKGYAKGQTIILPAIYVFYLFNAENNLRLIKGTKIAVDIALITIGVGEVRAAIALGKGAYQTYLIIKAAADLGVGTMDLVIQEGYAEEWSKTEEGKIRLERWNNINLMFAATTLSASTVDGVITRLGKRTIQTEKEWVQVMDELEEVAKRGTMLPSLLRQLTSKPSYLPHRAIFNNPKIATTITGKWDEMIVGEQRGLKKVFEELSQNGFTDRNLYDVPIDENLVNLFKTDKRKFVEYLEQIYKPKFVEEKGAFNLLDIDSYRDIALALKNKGLKEIDIDLYIWEVYNKPWLERALQRGDDIVIWSNPNNISKKVYRDTGETGITFFEMEVEFMKANASKYGYNWENGVVNGVLKRKL